MIHPIVMVPDERLRLQSEEITIIDDELIKLAQDMWSTILKTRAVGLAAIQIGVPKRIIILSINNKPGVFINPKIIKASEEKTTNVEMCLSIPVLQGLVTRPAEIEAEFVDLKGTLNRLKAKGSLAIVLQHEIDHTNGILFIDHISKIKRDRYLKKLNRKPRRKKLQ